MTTPPHDLNSPPTGEELPSSQAPALPPTAGPDYRASHARAVRSPYEALTGVPYGPSYPVQAYGGQQGPPPKKTLAIWALVLGWVPCLLGWIACIVLVITVFTRSRPGEDHGKKLAMFGIAGIGFYALLIGAVYIWSPFTVHRDSAGHVTSAGDVAIDSMRVGDCGSHQLEGMTNKVHLVPCSDAHTFQVMATFELQGAAYPGDDVVTRLAQEGCTMRLRAMPELAGRSDLRSFLMRPVASTWGRQRTVVCMAVWDQPATGSLASS